MEQSPQVNCPNCGRTDPKATSKAYDYPSGGGAWDSRPVALTYVYRCKCGHSFTHTVKIKEPPNTAG